MEGRREISPRERQAGRKDGKVGAFAEKMRFRSKLPKKSSKITNILQDAPCIPSVLAEREWEDAFAARVLPANDEGNVIRTCKANFSIIDNLRQK